MITFMQTQNQEQLLMKVTCLTKICTTAISNINTSLSQRSGWIIDSVIDHNINISK